MRTWIPRRPSAKHKQRLFDLRRVDSPDSSWLQPARLGTLAASLAVLALSGYAALNNPGLNGNAYHPVMALTLSNQTRGTSLPGTYLQPHTFQNAPPAQRFESTTPPASHSSIFSLSQLGTNQAR
jgi:hypothetical protein